MKEPKKILLTITPLLLLALQLSTSLGHAAPETPSSATAAVADEPQVSEIQARKEIQRDLSLETARLSELEPKYRERLPSLTKSALNRVTRRIQSMPYSPSH